MSASKETGPTVLLVEDDAAVTQSLTRYLGVAGYVTVTATSVEEALRCLEAAAPSIIVTDIFLKQGNGFDVIAAVRSELPDLPIIAMSGGRADHDVLAQAAKLGADATIEKPFSYAYLVNTIDRCLEARALSTASRTR